MCLKSLGFDPGLHKKRRNSGRRRALLAGMVLLIAGAVAPLRAQQAAAPTALSLDDALRMGSRISHTVKSAEAGVLRARGGQYQARSGYLPQVTGSLSYQRILQSQFEAIAGGSGSSSPDTTTTTGSGGGGGGSSLQNIEKIFAAPNTVILGVAVSQNVFTAGRLSAATQGAAAARTTAEIGLDAARAQVTLDVAQAYYNAVASDKLVEIEDSTLAQAERTLRQTTVSRQVGASAEFDLLRARVARDNQRPVVIQAKSNRDIAYLRLRQLLGISLTQPLHAHDVRSAMKGSRTQCRGRCSSASRSRWRAAIAASCPTRASIIARACVRPRRTSPRRNTRSAPRNGKGFLRHR